jgi:hypothetical protein
LFLKINHRWNCNKVAFTITGEMRICNLCEEGL